MLVLVPLAFVLGMLALMRRIAPAEDWRLRALQAAIVTGATLVAITELASLAHALTAATLAIAWAIAIAVVLGALFVLPRRHAPEPQTGATLDRPTRLLLIYLAAAGGALALIAWLAPPNNYDSMTYHMSRVMHWIQNGDLSNYPTSIVRQLHLASGAEFALLHAQLLWGDDRLANFVQWTAMALSVMGVSLLARAMGADARGQVFAATICATVPMGMMQATSTQNNYVAACWTIASVAMAVHWLRSGRRRALILLGAAAGLALGANQTSYLYGAALACCLGVAALRRHGVAAVAPLGLAAVVAISLNAGPAWRNFELSGDPFGTGLTEVRGLYTNARHDLPAIASNVVRNAGLELGTVEWLDTRVEAAIRSMHRAMGIDPSDPGTTWQGTKFHVQALVPNEDVAGSPIHLVLIAGAVVAAFARPRQGLRIAIAAALVLSVLLFAAVLKWQPWHNRLHLPLFVLGSALGGAWLADWHWRGLATMLAAALALVSVNWIAGNRTRPLLFDRSVLVNARADLYYLTDEKLHRTYADAADFVARSGCSHVGLRIGPNSWEYPIWVEFGARGYDVRIEHVLVANESARYGQAPRQREFEPCVILTLDVPTDGALVLHGVTFARAATFGTLVAFRADPGSASAPSSER